MIFHVAVDGISISKAFFAIGTAGSYHGLSNIYSKHAFFHQSKLRRDVELQTTHIVLLKSPRNVMSVSTLSAQLGIGLELVDCYPDALSVPYGYLLIDLSPRTDDRLRFCGNTRSIPSKFYISEPLKRSKLLDNEHAKSVLSKCSNHYITNAKVFFSTLPKRNYQVPVRL